MAAHFPACYDNSAKDVFYAHPGGQRPEKIHTTRFGGNQAEALKNITVNVNQGEYVAIMGESRSRSTTLCFAACP